MGYCKEDSLVQQFANNPDHSDGLTWYKEDGPVRNFFGCGHWSGSISPGRQKLGGNLELETDGRTDGQSWLRSEPTNNYPPNINPLPGWTGRKVKPSRVKYQLWSHLNSEVWQGWDWVELPQTLQNCCSIRKVLDWVLVDIFGLF